MQVVNTIFVIKEFDQRGSNTRSNQTLYETVCVCVCPQMFVEIWLHHYSLEMYQKLQSPQVKVGETSPTFPPLPPLPALQHCTAGCRLADHYPAPSHPHTPSAITAPPPTQSRMGEKWSFKDAMKNRADGDIFMGKTIVVHKGLYWRTASRSVMSLAA